MEKQELVKRLIEEEKRYGLPVLMDYVFGNDIIVKTGVKLSDCNKSIDELFLSVRSQNALRRAQIDTIGNLVDRLNEGTVKGIRNLGRKSYSEIQTKLLVYHYENMSEERKAKFFSMLIDENSRAKNYKMKE